MDQDRGSSFLVRALPRVSNRVIPSHRDDQLGDDVQKIDYQSNRVCSVDVRSAL